MFLLFFNNNFIDNHTDSDITIKNMLIILHINQFLF